jgi:hypothetical protein
MAHKSNQFSVFNLCRFPGRYDAVLPRITSGRVDARLIVDSER